jgi:hypothetical protein
VHGLLSLIMVAQELDMLTWDAGLQWRLNLPLPVEVAQIFGPVNLFELVVLLPMAVVLTRTPAGRRALPAVGALATVYLTGNRARDGSEAVRGRSAG